MSMRVDWVILCRSVEAHDGLADIKGAGIDHVVVTNLPGTVVLNFAIRFSGVHEEGKRYTVTLDLRDEGGHDTPLADPNKIEVVFTDRVPGTPLDFPVSDVVGVECRPFIPYSGVYTVIAAIDGNIATLPVRIYDAENPEFERFKNLARQLLAVPKDEVKKPERSGPSR